MQVSFVKVAISYFKGSLCPYYDYEKMSVFEHTQGIKTVNAEGEGRSNSCRN